MLGLIGGAIAGICLIMQHAALKVQAREIKKLKAAAPEANEAVMITFEGRP